MKMQILFYKAFEMHSTLKTEVNTQTRRDFLELQELWMREFPPANQVNQTPNIIYFLFFL